MAGRCQAAGRGAYQQGKVEAATGEVTHSRGHCGELGESHAG